MAYTSPTYADFVALYPRFAEVPEATFNLYLAKAQAKVGENWLEKDYATAQELYIAHLMTVEGLGTGVESELGGAGLQGIRSLRSGALSIEKDSGADAASAVYGELGSTSYGRRFIALARLNFPAVAAAAICATEPSHLAKDWPLGD